MRKKLLGLFDSDLVYMERFYGFLKDSRIPFNVVAFTDVEALMGQNGKEVPDYLVVSEDYLNKVDNFPGVKIGIFEERNPRGLYRYSPADENLKTLVKLLQISESDYGLGNATSTKFIGVFSPVARTGKTSFSLVLGQLLAKNKKVLYLNFESFSGMSISVGRRNSDLSDVMYYFNNLQKDFATKFRESIEKINGLDYIPPAYYFIDLTSITAEKWEKFLEAIAGMNEYDYVIMDLSDFLQGLFDVFLTSCDYIYMLTSNDSRAANKIFHYESVLKEYEYTDILTKTRKSIIPTIRNLPEDPDRLIYSDMAEYVRKETKGDFDFI